MLTLLRRPHILVWHSCAQAIPTVRNSLLLPLPLYLTNSISPVRLMMLRGMTGQVLYTCYLN